MSRIETFRTIRVFADEHGIQVVKEDQVHRIKIPMRGDPPEARQAYDIDGTATIVDVCDTKDSVLTISHERS